MITRRTVLRAGAVSVVAVAAAPLGGCGDAPAAGIRRTGRLVPSALPLPPPFTLPLRLPPASRPSSAADGAAVHRLVAERADLEILPGIRTPALTYGGSLPGPTIESRRGRPTRVDFVNRLGPPAVVHLHGGVTPAGSDGFPTDLVLPEGTTGVAGTPGMPGMPGATVHAGHQAEHERCDVVVDFGRYPVGTRITLRNGLGGGTTGSVMQFVVARRGAQNDTRVPAVLAPVEEPLRTTGPGVVRRTFRFRRGAVGDGAEGWTVNDRPFDPTRMIASPRAGSVEVWRFGSDVNHPVHVRLGHFRVLSRGGRKPGPGDLGWKDTVDLRAVEYVDVAIRFPKLTGRYVLHCHNLEHENMMMMAAFEVS